MESVKRIALITSGGDAPGMNAAIRGVVRCAVNNGIEVYGFLKGYAGILANDYRIMDKRSVSDIVDRGGTILFTARCKEYQSMEGTGKACDILKKDGVDALVVLGGDGSYAGALRMAKNFDMNIIGVPATIDLDIACTEYTIGFDTAINTAMEGVDRIRDTSTSHERCSIIEVMGRRAGYIAAYTGISTGAEEIIIPEKNTYDEVKSIAARVKEALKNGKTHYIIINAEGIGRSQEMAEYIEKETGVETRVSVLGYLQRGGSPTCKDRVYASVMGCKAVEALMSGKKNRVICYRNGEFTDMDMEEALAMQKEFPEFFVRTAKELESR